MLPKYKRLLRFAETRLAPPGGKEALAWKRGSVSGEGAGARRSAGDRERVQRAARNSGALKLGD